MRILYLDQNKWIELAQAVKSSEDFPAQHKILATLVGEANAGRLLVPLTATNLYETQKIKIPERRNHLAWVQATLSQGMVFRGRYRRLEVEVIDLLRARNGLSAVPREARWFLSNIFIEATAELGDPRLPPVSDKVLRFIQSDPPRFMFEFLTGSPEDVRALAVSKFSDGSERLRQDIEERRIRDASESISMRRRMHSARLMINELDLILSFVRKAGLTETDENVILKNHARNIINECPTYFIEREIGLRIEAQSRPIEENDFRDMQTFCAVLAYANIVVAENMFSNLAMQAGLHKKYDTHITTSLADIPNTLRAV